MFQSHCYSVANDAIVAKDCVAAIDDSTEMVDSEPPSKRHLAGKIDASQYLGNNLQHLIEQGKRHAQRPPANGVAAASKAVYGEHPKTLPGQHLPVGMPILAQILNKIDLDYRNEP